MLLIGASLTQAAVYPQHLLDLAKADENVAVRLIGSRGANNKPADGELRHEGYNGWTAQAFVTLHGPLSRTGEYKRPDTGSPFVFEDQPGKLTLDFTRYYDQFNEGMAPDFITIHLGPNEIFSCTDETIDETIDKAMGYYDQLIAKIHEAGPATRIGIVLVGPATNSQDGFRNYAGTRKQTAWQYKRNYHRLIERMIKYYADRTKENLYLVPVNVNLDAANHYPTWTAPRNARSSEKVTRVNNGTHPADEGYRQAGDMIYCWLKAMLDNPK
jgi:lysophospholipase L1-like esterase